MHFATTFARVRTLCCAIAFLHLTGSLLPRGIAQAAPPAPDRTHIEEVLRGLNRGRGVGQVAVSPDGSRLAWIEGGGRGRAVFGSARRPREREERWSERAPARSIAAVARDFVSDTHGVGGLKGIGNRE